MLPGTRVALHPNSSHAKGNVSHGKMCKSEVGIGMPRRLSSQSRGRAGEKAARHGVGEELPGDRGGPAKAWRILV
jgi:hypothetical protein